MTLKAVITDVDGTLYRQAPVRRRMIKSLLSYTVRHPKAGWDTMRCLQAYRRSQEILRRERTRDASEQAEMAAQMAGYSPGFVRQCATRWMEREPLPAVASARYPGVIEFFQWARETGLRLAVCSDYDPRDKLRLLGLETYMEVLVWAQEPGIGVFKPDPRGLCVVLDRLGIEPAEAVYIGDRADVDGSAAANAGIPGILLGARHARDLPGIQVVSEWYEIRNLLEARMSSSPSLTVV